MIKLLSTIAIAVPMLLFGFYQSYKDSYRQSDLKELYKALNLFKNEISYSYRTIAESFKNISTKVSSPTSAVFSTISTTLENENTLTFEQIFENAIFEYKDLLYLNDADIQEFISLSKTINYLDNTSIISFIDIFLSYLENEISTLDSITIKNKKTYQSLTVLSTLLIIIVLL